MAHTHVRITAQTVERDGERFVLWAITDPDPRATPIAMGVTRVPRHTSCVGCGRHIGPEDLVLCDEDGVWCTDGDRPCR